VALAQGAVRTVDVVVIGVLGQYSLEMPAPEDQHPVEHLAANGADPPLRVGIRPRRPHRRAQHLDALGGKHRIERGGELGIPIPDQEPEPPDAVVKTHEQVAGLLGHPRPGWMGCHTEHVDPAGGHLEHEQHLQPLQEDGIDGEEVHRQYTLGLRPEELPPGHGRPLGCWFDTGALQNRPYGAGPYGAAEVAQLTVDPDDNPRSGSPLPVAAPTREVRWSPPAGRYGAGGSSGAGPGRDAIAAAWSAAQPSLPQRAWQQLRKPSQHRAVGPVHPGRATCRLSTATWCRNTSSSAFLEAERRASSTGHPSSWQKIR
jgi:hypothetical protein